MGKESLVEISRLLYRSLLRASAELERELQRGQNLLAAKEWEAIRRVSGIAAEGQEEEVSEAEFAARGSEKVPFVGILREAFKNGKTAQTSRELDIDAGFRTLKYMNWRLPVLRKLVYRDSSNTITNGVRVKVCSSFLGPDKFGYKFAYNVRVANECSEPVTLVNREWVVVDSDGRKDVVRGSGVVGQQPIIEPGSTYEYNSGTPLRTTMGSMWGKYEMVKQNKKEVFEAEIAPFALLVPRDWLAYPTRTKHVRQQQTEDQMNAK